MKIGETYHFSNEDNVFRIVDIQDTAIYYVNLFNKRSYVPKSMSPDEWLEQMHSGTIVKADDPFLSLEMPQLKGKDLERSQRNWQWIQELWGEHKRELLNHATRHETIKDFARSKNCNAQTIKNLLTNFYIRGMNEQSVSTGFKRCGHAGKERNQTRKTGRKTARPSPSTKEIEDLFEKSYRRFYLNKASSTIQSAYEDMLEAFFSEDSTIKTEGRPSYLQFWRWIKQKDLKEILTKKGARNEFELNHRILKSSTNADVSGPGDVFEIDATPLDCHIVSRSNRNNVIGRPVLYLIVDRYSRLITGMSVGLYGPSWIGAVGAFENMVADKVDYCKSFGIEIGPEDWPVKDLIPYSVIGDRGEMISENSSTLVKNLKTRVNNTSPYRGDLKANVERSFGVINQKIRERIEGAVLKEYYKRGDKDPRDKAKLTLEEITAVCINCVLYFNKRLIKDFPLSEDQIAFGVPAQPISLWNYGVEHSLHCFNNVDGDSFRRKILPVAKRSVGRRGIKFNNLIYTAGDQSTQTWLERNQKREITFSYDPLDVSQIYFMDGDRELKLVLADTFASFKSMTFEEAKRYDELRRERDKNLEELDLQNKIDLNVSLKQINDSAPKPDTSVSKASRKKKIRENRRDERRQSSNRPLQKEEPPANRIDEQDPLSNYYDVIEKTLRKSNEQS